MPRIAWRKAFCSWLGYGLHDPILPRSTSNGRTSDHNGAVGALRAGARGQRLTDVWACSLSSSPVKVRNAPAWGRPGRITRPGRSSTRSATPPGATSPRLLLDADAETLKATRNAQLAAFTLEPVILDAARGAGRRRPVGGGRRRATASASTAPSSPPASCRATEGARLVAARGEAMQDAADAAPGTMAAVLGLDPDLVAQACADVDGAWVANDNAPGQIVVAGHRGRGGRGRRSKRLGPGRQAGDGAAGGGRVSLPPHGLGPGRRWTRRWRGDALGRPRRPGGRQRGRHRPHRRLVGAALGPAGVARAVAGIPAGPPGPRRHHHPGARARAPSCRAWSSGPSTGWPGPTWPSPRTWRRSPTWVAKRGPPARRAAGA